MKRHARQAINASLFAGVTLLAPTAFAYDAPSPVAKVAFVEVSYQPGAVYFQIDQTVANCPTGDFILWEGGATYPPGNAATEADRKTNVKQVTNTLLMAMHTGGRVRVYARNKTASTSCVAEFLHALPAL